MGTTFCFKYASPITSYAKAFCGSNSFASAEATNAASAESKANKLCPSTISKGGYLDAFRFVIFNPNFAVA